MMKRVGRATGVVLTLVGLAGRASAQIIPGAAGPAAGQTPMQRTEEWQQLSPEELGLLPRASPPKTPAAPLPMTVEPPAPRFGAPGARVVTAESALGLSSTRYERSDASELSAAGNVGVDVFVLRSFSIGGELGAAYAETRSYAADSSLVRETTKGIFAGPRVGYALELGQYVSWFPRASIGFVHASYESRILSDAASAFSGTESLRTRQSGLYVSAFAPIVFHPRPHFFLGAGPAVVHQIGDDDTGPRVGTKPTTVSARFVLGVWWGGAVPEPLAAQTSAAPSPPRPSFGASGQWVFTGEVGGSVSHTGYRGISASTSVLSITPGFDYFVGRRLSLGMLGSLYRGRRAGPSPDGGESRNDVTAFDLGVRVGGDVPLASWLSFYPRGSLTAGRRAYDLRSASDRNQGAYTVVTFGFYAPLLVHVATHAFVGFGPYVQRDLHHEYEGRRSSNFATRVGASLVVGGWL